MFKKPVVQQEGTAKNFKPKEQLATDTTSSRPEWLKCGTLLSDDTVQARTVNKLKSCLQRDWRGHPDLYNDNFSK